ncbi:hypothetical protein N7454_006767 [Penicillium verhagenii]|nr:hypothetical protein N7454_006767 [Penicillium verhagenii]
MASNKHNPPARKKGAIHFVNARPTTEFERIKVQRMVRAHVGRWISDQTKQRLNTAISPINRELSSDKFTSGRSFTLVSRPAPNQPQHRNPSLPGNDIVPFSFADPVDPSLTRPTCSPQGSDDSESSDEVATLPTHSRIPAILPWGAIIALDRQISGPIDPFTTYPANLQMSPQAVDVCTSYCLNTMWPGVVPGQDSSLQQIPSLPRLSWFSLARSDPVLFTAFMYGSLCHQRVLWANRRLSSDSYGPIQHRLLEKCETDSIILINRAVHDPSRAISDAILLSVVCMAHHAAPTEIKIQSTPFHPPFQQLQWLDVYGCLAPNVIHVQGLVQLLKLRGGIRNVQLPGLAATLSFSEVFAAAVWCTQPIFEFWPLDETRLGIPLQKLIGFGSSDIQHGFGRLQVIGFTAEMAEAFQAARSYINIIQKSEEILKQSIDNHLNESLLADQRNFTEYTLLALLPSEAITSYFSHPTQGTTYEACRLAGLIFGIGVIFPIPEQNSPLKTLAKKLRTTLLQETAEALWSSATTRVPLIWILTLGGIAAFGSPDRSFFVSSLADVARHSNIRSWSGIQLALDEMLWHEGAGEKAGRDIWREVENYLEQNHAELEAKPCFSTK